MSMRTRELVGELRALSSRQRRLLARALRRPPRRGEKARTVNLGFGSLEWKVIMKPGYMQDRATGEWSQVDVSYGPYAYLRIWGRERHHSFYLGGAANPVKANMVERMTEWLAGGTVGQLRRYTAGQFPAGRGKRKLPGRKVNLLRHLAGDVERGRG